jgi:hypothetical protein
VLLSYLFLPVFYVGSKRWRVRFRLASWQIGRKVDVYPEGIVHTLRFGPLLIVAMVDEVKHGPNQ